MPSSDKVSSILFSLPSNEVFPETLPLITYDVITLTEDSHLNFVFSKTTDKCCSLGKPYPVIKLSPNNKTFSILILVFFSLQLTNIILNKSQHINDQG